jgi:preprotein translocase subunit Sec61beta
MRRLRRSAAGLVRWWWGYPSRVEVAARAVVLAGILVVAFEVSRGLGFAVWALGLAVMYIGGRRRQSADERAGLVPDRDEVR